MVAYLASVRIGLADHFDNNFVVSILHHYFSRVALERVRHITLIYPADSSRDHLYCCRALPLPTRVPHAAHQAAEPCRKRGSYAFDNPTLCDRTDFFARAPRCFGDPAVDRDHLIALHFLPIREVERAHGVTAATTRHADEGERQSPA